jgi:hypothetical protein
MDKTVKSGAKKVYSPPQLTVYGTVRELTQKVGPTQRTDGGKFPKNRTGTH